MSEAANDSEMPKRRRREAVKSFLSGDRTPMWFSLFVLLLGGGGTYFLAPRVNAQFEEQKIKSDFVIKNYGDLRTKMEEFQGLYAVVTQKLVAGEDVRADVFKLQELNARISAQNLSLLPMFSTESGPKAASELNAALNGMIQVIFANAGKKIESEAEVAAYQAQVAEAMQKMVSPLLELYVRIGDVGRLRPIEKNQQLAKP
ncbi:MULTISPECIES: hypothetical protein [unclassified Beijerinckia]|uniref:hypothetical protein n=1 Tax=unclassified Beijerinckia TaxID=2638183 RepID=UPI0008959BB7|nr:MULTISPECIES: hypothetical protein [unclassified Beijerinckia]MDH7794965.1 hypothetical protein [Beijerinckia sp. GAS462]SEB82178.1 hypothetical protein SAMN05443249_1238 [Beijerinckia sp. 28-YEA-48]